MIMKTNDELETEKEIIVLLDNRGTPSVHYSYTEAQDIYRISGIEVFSGMIEHFINKSKEIKLAYVIRGLDDLLGTCSILYNMEGDRERYKQKYMEYYQNNLQQLSVDQGQDIKIIPSLARGQCDRPMSFDLRIIIDSSELKHDHLSAVNIRIQQFARFLALKHGGSLLATQSMDILHESPIIASQENIESKSVFSFSPQSSDDEFSVNLFLPKGWDSWSKIKFLAKAVIDSTGSVMFKEDSDFQEFDSLYNDLLEGKLTKEDILGQHLKIVNYEKKNDQPTGSKTFEEHLSSILSPDEDSEDSDQLDESMLSQR